MQIFRRWIGAENLPSKERAPGCRPGEEVWTLMEAFPIKKLFEVKNE
jgi:hypothetical protein